MTNSLPKAQLLPGVDPETARDRLAGLIEDLRNERASAHAGRELRSTYVRWLEGASLMLNRLFVPESVHKLLPTNALSHILPLSPLDEEGSLVHLLYIVLDETLISLDEALHQLQMSIQYWSRPGALFVTDTNFLLHYPHEISELPETDFSVPPGLPLVLVVPILVVDELDNLKRSRAERYQASRSIRVLERTLAHGPDPTTIRAGAVGAQLISEITLEVVLDRLGHERLPIPDDEIVMVATRIQQFWGRSVTFVTYDRGAKLRATNMGLQTLLLDMPPSEKRRKRA